MCAVDHHGNALGAGKVADLLHREDQPGRAGDMADEYHPGAVVEPGGEVFQEGLPGGDRQADVLSSIGGALAAAMEVPGPVAGAVLDVGGEDFVAGAEVEVHRHGIHGEGGVGDVHQVIRVAAVQVSREGGP
jgi:hypothetical protein